MGKILFLIAAFLILSSCTTSTEEQGKKDILAIIDAQQIAWPKHDLEGFMQGYWKSDSLKFYGSNGVTFGWDKTLTNYKKGYPTSYYSGTLNFKINHISKINKNTYFVMGEYYLKRKVGNANGEWRIIADTSC